jgi:hypothetical protein
VYSDFCLAMGSPNIYSSGGSYTQASQEVRWFFAYRKHLPRTSKGSASSCNYKLPVAAKPKKNKNDV